jgi:hypothetical protein
MKKLENLGRKLSKDEQKKIFGGDDPPTGCEDQCTTNAECNPNGGTTFVCAKDLIPGCGWDYKRCTIF